MPAIKELKIGQEVTDKGEISMNTERIAKLQEEIKSLKQKMDNFELDTDEYKDDYDEMLDEIYGDFMNYSASFILQNVDEIVYWYGLTDYVDGIGKEECQGYQDLIEALEELENELEELENELEELESEE